MFGSEPSRLLRPAHPAAGASSSASCSTALRVLEARDELLSLAFFLLLVGATFLV